MKAYYEEGQGTVDPVLIGLRPGSYVPVFRWLDAQPAKHREEIGAAPPPGRICVAVLPFVNMSPEPEQDYFCDGISEEITNSLTRVSGLNVIARTSAFHFKGANIDIREVGQRLGANLVIEGSVGRPANSCGSLPRRFRPNRVITSGRRRSVASSRTCLRSRKRLHNLLRTYSGFTRRKYKGQCGPPLLILTHIQGTCELDF